MNITVLDIVVNAARMLGLDSVVDKIEKQLYDDKDVKKLCYAANLVIGEIAADYLPLVDVKRVVVSGGRLLYSQLHKKVVRVCCVQDTFGRRADFRAFAAFCAVDDGVYDVEFHYLPDALSMGDETPFACAAISERVLAYGTAAEYSIAEGLLENATLWDRRFRESLSSTSGRGLKYKGRMWY